jgi:Undecaprenyl-phosphate galactose phosphotransferase WbaP
VIRERPRARFGCVLQRLITLLPLLIADLVAAAASILFADTVMRYWTPSWQTEAGMVLPAIAAGLVISNTILRLYPGTGLHPMVEMRAASLSVLLTNGLLLAAMWLGERPAAVIIQLQLAVLFLVVLLPLFRTMARHLCARMEGWGQAALVLGDGESAIRVFDALRNHPDCGLRPVGVLGDPMTFDRDLRDYPYFGPMSEAADVARRSSAYWAVIAMPNRPGAEVSAIVNECAAEIPNVVVTSADGIPSLWSHPFSAPGFSGVYFQRGLLLPLPRIMKRAFDVAACLVGGILILPLLLLIVAAIRLDSPGPVIYKQRRIGRHGQYFFAWKFRTMVVAADRVLEEYLNSNPEYRREWESDHKLRDDPRVTPIGRLLRKTSLDELPQVWNALKGEMSLVGPRPIVDAEVEKYGRDFELYTCVRPGISGLWQVSGRNDTTYEQRVALDSYYVRNWSPWMDIYILIKTIGVIVRGQGAY